MRIRSLSPLLFVVLVSPMILAQRPVTSSGRGPTPSINSPNTPAPKNSTEIQVRVAWANEHSVNDIIHVQLLTMSGIPIAETFTTREGMAEFRNQKFGTYQLRLDGANIVDKITERFQIMQGETMHMERVHVSPKDPNHAVGGKPQGQISAADMNVPDKARKEMEKGMDSLGRNDLKEADKHFEKAVTIYPKYARAWNNLGVVRAKEGDRSAAADAWQKAIAADEKYGSAYFNLARIRFANQQAAEAQKLIEKGLVGDPGDIEGLFLLATAQAMQGNWDQAIINARKVHNGEHKRFADCHMIAAQGLESQNQAKLAIQEYELYLKEYPDSPHASEVRKDMAQLQGKLQ